MKNMLTSKLLLGSFSAALFTLISLPIAEAQTSGQEFNVAEQWVAAQVAAGKLADLGAQFPNSEDRKLSARFLGDLLTGALSGAKPGRTGVQISGALVDERIDLTNAQIPCDLRLEHCQFTRPVTLNHTSFAGGISFFDSAFKSDADFSNMKVGGTAIFDYATFEGRVSFLLASIVDNFQAIGVKFQNKERSASFNSMKVGAAAFFRKAVFEGTADFLLANIGSNFEAQEARFNNKEQGAYFYAIRVGQIASFKKAVFEGRVEFDAADIGLNFEADQAQFNNKTAIVRMTMKCGKASFKDTVFAGGVSFQDSTFSTLDLSGSVWPAKVGALDLQGMSYKYVRAGWAESESHEALLRLADRSTYNADVYANLEEFFARLGKHDDADRAFIAGKCRERKERLHGLSWLGSWFLYLLVGYGRHPAQAGYLCAFFVALGCGLFSPKKMELQRPEDASRVYNRFWYSLGLFLPFVDLQVDKVWRPKKHYWVLRNYVRVHTLLGWILIPLLLAAISGVIK